MTTPPLPNALTPEEWARPHTTLGDNPKMGIFARASVRNIEPGDNVDPTDRTVLVIIPPRTLDHRGIVCDAGQRHALAALALHGQSFGPTWDMVDVLREVSQYRMLTHRESEGLASVIAFVQALLPPRVDDVPQAKE